MIHLGDYNCKICYMIVYSGWFDWLDLNSLNWLNLNSANEIVSPEPPISHVKPHHLLGAGSFGDENVYTPGLHSVPLSTQVYNWVSANLMGSLDHAVHTTEYLGLCSIKRLGIFLLHPEWDARPLQGTPPPPQHYVAGTHLYTWVEGGTMRGKCVAKEHNTVNLARAARSTLSGIRRTNH